MKMGRRFYIANRSTGVVTVNYNDNSQAKIIKPGTERTLILIDNSTSNGAWDISTGSGSGSGGGGSGLNLLSVADLNFDAEASTTNWNNYNDGASTDPVAGTGGSPSWNLTLARTTTAGEILDGIGSFKLSKNANSTQGEGVSIDVPVPKGYRGQPCEVMFPFLTSANFVGGDLSDLRIWLYDVTNAKLIQPDDHRIQVPGGFGDIYRAFGSIPLSCDTIRIIFHVATTNAVAWDFIYDDVSLIPASPIVDTSDAITTAKTHSTTNRTTATGVYTTVIFDVLDYDEQALFNGTIDTATIKKAGKYRLSGSIWFAGNATGVRGIAYRVNGGSESEIAQLATAADSSEVIIPFAIEDNFEVGDTIELRSFQNSGGNLNVDANSTFVLSRVASLLAGPETKDSSVNAYGTATGTLNGSLNVVKFPAAEVDTDVQYDSSTGLITVKKPGRFFIIGSVGVQQTGGAFQIAVGRNGSSELHGKIDSATSGTSAWSTVHAIVDCVVDDTLGIYAAATGTSPVFGTDNQTLSMFRVPGGQQAGVPQKIVASYLTTTAGSYADGTETVVDFDTKDSDDMGLVTTGASWNFTAKVAQWYKYSAVIGLSVSASTGASFSLHARKNGTVINRNAQTVVGGGSDDSSQVVGAVFLNVGDTLDFTIRNDLGSAVGLQTGAGYNSVQITANV
jgi:hypothetical protein